MLARRYGMLQTRVVSVSALLIAIAVGYLVGSVPVAVLVARARGFDPRMVGDRNPGYWNMKEQVGNRSSVPVFVGDVAKGLVAGGVGVALDGTAWGIAYAAVAAAMVGHAFPLFAQFRGGRSILTFTGGVIVLVPPAAAVAVGATILVALVARSFAVGARVGVFGYPVAQLWFESKERVAATGVLMTIIGIRFAQAAIADRSRPDRRG